MFKVQCSLSMFVCRNGGRGIRTPETVPRLTVFKTAAFNHSAIPPSERITEVTWGKTIVASVLPRSIFRFGTQQRSLFLRLLTLLNHRLVEHGRMAFIGDRGPGTLV